MSTSFLFTATTLLILIEKACYMSKILKSYNFGERIDRDKRKQFEIQRPKINLKKWTRLRK